MGRVDTSYAYWKKNKINKNLVEENNTGEGRLIYAPEQEMVEITPEQQMKQDSNGTTERKHVSMKILTCKEQDYMVEIDKG